MLPVLWFVVTGLFSLSDELGSAGNGNVDRFPGISPSMSDVKAPPEDACRESGSAPDEIRSSAFAYDTDWVGLHTDNNIDEQAVFIRSEAATPIAIKTRHGNNCADIGTVGPHQFYGIVGQEQFRICTDRKNNIVSVEETSAKLTGYGRSELIGKNLVELLIATKSLDKINGLFEESIYFIRKDGKSMLTSATRDRDTWSFRVLDEIRVRTKRENGLLVPLALSETPEYLADLAIRDADLQPGQPSYKTLDYKNAKLPVKMEADGKGVVLTVLPFVSGIIWLRSDLTLYHVPAYLEELFGYSGGTVLAIKNISALLPGLWIEEQLGFSKSLSPMPIKPAPQPLKVSLKRRPFEFHRRARSWDGSHWDLAEPEPQVVMAIHSDGGRFEVETCSRPACLVDDATLIPVVVHYRIRGLPGHETLEHPSSREASRANVPEVTVEFSSHTIDDYVVEGSVGEGAYEYVRIGYHKDSPSQRVVIKKIQKSKIFPHCRLPSGIPIEVHVLSHLSKHDHPNLVKLLDTFEDDVCYWLVMPVHGAGLDLFDYVDHNDFLDIDVVRKIFRQVVEATRYLHSLDIVHCDIKDENIIINDDCSVRLIDFGSSAYLRRGPDGQLVPFKKFHGTLDYAPPEVILGKPCDGPPQDIYALGILLYILLYKEIPYRSVAETMHGTLRFPFTKCPEAVELVRKLLAAAIEERPSAEDVLNHAFLKQL